MQFLEQRLNRDVVGIIRDYLMPTKEEVKRLRDEANDEFMRFHCYHNASGYQYEHGRTEVGRAFVFECTVRNYDFHLMMHFFKTNPIYRKSTPFDYNMSRMQNDPVRTARDYEEGYFHRPLSFDYDLDNLVDYVRLSYIGEKETLSEKIRRIKSEQ